MNIVDCKNEIESTNWAKQGVIMSPFFVSVIFHGLTKTLQDEIGESFGTIYAYFSQEGCPVYFPQPRIDKLAGYYFNKKSEIGKLFRSWLNERNDLEKEVNKIRNLKLSSLTDQEIYGLWDNFFKRFLLCWAHSGFVEAHDNTFHDLMEKCIKTANLANPLSHQEIETLLLPGILTTVQLERQKFLQLLIRIKKIVPEISREKISSNKEIRELINSHLDKFYYLSAGYSSGEEVSFNETVGRIIKELQENNFENEAKNLEELSKHYESDLPKAKKDTINTHAIPSDLTATFHYFVTTSIWREKRKEMHQIGIVAQYKLIVEIARRANIPKNLIPWLSATEINRDFHSLKKLIPELTSRSMGCIKRSDDKGSTLFFTGQDATDIHDMLEGTLIPEAKNLIEGRSACKGKTIGKVKIVLSPSAFSKFSSGDILVTSMTRSEFMPVVRLASAIITDEGGITSHAAIISRELNIPCIIGTKIATKVLHDGDLVEVDTDKGIVKIIKGERNG